MIRFGRIVNVVGSAGNGRFDAQIVKLAIGDSMHEVTAYAKKLDDIDFLVELMSALIGRDIGLPIPEPVIAFSEDGNDVLFASVDMKHPDLSKRLLIESDKVVDSPENRELFELVSNWSQIELAISFDEWLANEDRNVGNILFDGGDEFYLIDHNLAMRPHFSPENPITNALMNIKLIFSGDEIARFRLKSHIQLIIEQIDGSKPDSIAKELGDSYSNIDSELLTRMLHFLHIRLNFLAQITTEKIPLSQQTI